MLSVPHMNEDFEHGQRAGSGDVDDGDALTVPSPTVESGSLA